MLYIVDDDEAVRDALSLMGGIATIYRADKDNS